MSRKSKELASVPLLIVAILIFPLYFLAAEYQDVTVFGVRLAGPFILLLICFVFGGGLLSMFLLTKR